MMRRKPKTKRYIKVEPQAEDERADGAKRADKHSAKHPEDVARAQARTTARRDETRWAVVRLGAEKAKRRLPSKRTLAGCAVAVALLVGLCGVAASAGDGQDAADEPASAVVEVAEEDAEEAEEQVDDAAADEEDAADASDDADAEEEAAEETTSQTASSSASSTSSLDGELVVHFIDVGQGDATFIEFPDGSCMLIDAGKSSAASTVKSYIRALGYTKIDYLVATHPDADHIGGLAAVIEAFSIGEVWAPDATNDTQTFEGFLDAVEAAGLQIDVAEEGATIVSSKGCEATVVGPAVGATSEDTNDLSAVILVEYGDTSFLFTGDAPAGKIPSVDIDVLKVSHHGSSTGTTTSLMKKLTPSVAVISYGADNSYGHPTQTVLDALDAVDATVYGTAVNGDVVVTSDGSDLSVKTESSGTVTANSTGSSSGSSGSSSSSSSSKSSSSSSSDTVYVTATGEKYHTSTCRYVKGKDNLTAMTKSQAEAAGYEACKVCKP